MKTVKKNTLADKNNRDFINGVMLDPARIPLQFQWYERFIPWLAKWGYNTLLLNLADDTGCALRLKCRPELSSRGALTHAQIRRLDRLAAGHGLALAPIIATLGHAGYIFNRNPYRRLCDGLNESGRKVLCPARPESQKIVADILNEVMDLFPAPWIHIGLDETGELPKKTCRHCRKKFPGRTEPFFIVQRLQWLSDLAERRGKTVMYWALNRLRPERDAHISAGAPASSIGCAWQYDEGDQVYTDDAAVKFFIQARRGIIGVPSLACSPNTTILPNQRNLDNIRRFAAVIHAHRASPYVRGLVNSVWQHSYTLPGALIYGMAYGADQFKQANGTRGFPQIFAKTFFGAPAMSPAGNLLRDLHLCAPRFRDLHNLIECASPADIQAVTGQERRAAIQMGRKARAIAGGLRRNRRQARQNRDIYDAYILAADILAHIGDRALVFNSAKPGRAALRRLATRARALADAAWSAWDAIFDPGHPCRKLRAPPASQKPAQIDIDRYCYFGAPGRHSNKHLFRSLELSARFLRTLAESAPPPARRRP